MAAQRFTIRLAQGDARFPCRGDETVVTAMERAEGFGLLPRDGRAVPVGCRRGGCGVCRVRVLDGAYRLEPMSRAHVTEAEQADGYALACRIVPLGDLTLHPAPRPRSPEPDTPNNG
ncbi:2Fe-2S iron-sulfur cluster-binding protein [Azospirillum halopraeferens]|uniref:2Fe-2S iron-sulfur cluster-binding protein n=1 Tax=Azospirillum halopraeferens TaxID=34010 RepID=UPI000425A844|nr:2Fe-2S iron-sulfur cluster binding domain-containing protein [Azospirillum halopraeferens]